MTAPAEGWVPGVLCSSCFCVIRRGEFIRQSAFPPSHLEHASPSRCIERLRMENDAVRGERDAALVVVRAARVLRVRAWQCDRAARRLNRAHGDDTIRAYDAAYTAGLDAARAHRAALATYVKGDA